MFTQNVIGHHLEPRQLVGSQALAMNDPYTTHLAIQGHVNEFKQDLFRRLHAHVVQVDGVGNAEIASS